VVESPKTGMDKNLRFTPGNGNDAGPERQLGSDEPREIPPGLWRSRN